MSGHINGKLKPENSGFRKGEQSEDSADIHLNRQNVKSKKTGNNSTARLSKTDTHDILTDYDAVEIFNRVLLKKRNGSNP